MEINSFLSRDATFSLGPLVWVDEVQDIWQRPEVELRWRQERCQKVGRLYYYLMRLTFLNDRLMQYGPRFNLNETEFLTTNPHEAQSLSVAVICPALSDLNTSGQRCQPMKNCVMKLLHALTQPEGSGVPQLVCFVIDVVRPVVLYGSESWPTIKDNERRLAIMETKLVRCASGVTRFDNIRNEDIRDRYGVAPIVEELRERGLRWHGYAIRVTRIH